MKKDIKKNLLICFLLFMIIISFLGTLFYRNIKRNTKVTVEGFVKYIGDNYIIIEDKEQKEYSLTTNNSYDEGDLVSATIKNINKKFNPIESETVNINTISKTVTFSIIDKIKEDQDKVTDINSNRLTEEQSNNQTKEEEIVSFVENVEQKLENYNEDDKNIKTEIKESFIKIADFLFYGGTIKGKTFSELSDSAKLKVLKLFFSIDSKIEKKFPNYKKEISKVSGNVYTNLKEKAIETYLNITSKICQNKEALCNNAKEELKELKKSFSITWNSIKNISGIGLEKLKQWYEVWREAK